LYELKKEDEEIVARFNADKHYSKLEEIDWIILHKKKKPSLKKLYSSDIIPEMMKMITQLYPLYCFAISPQPMKELERFE
jgi:hypoxanthine phosphoribosyltransferase